MNFTKNKRKSAFRKIFGLLEIILTIIVITVCAIIVTQRLSNNEKSFFGYRLFKVETGSMIPKYNINDVILVIEKNPNEIKVGDDVVYVGNYGEYSGMVVTHQVVRIENDGSKIEFYTKGLANNAEDPVVQKEQIIGVVIAKSQVLTFITNMLLNPYTLYFLIVLPLTITIFFREIHSKDVKERYIQKQIEKEKNLKENKDVQIKNKKEVKAKNKKEVVQKNTKSKKNTKT